MRCPNKRDWLKKCELDFGDLTGTEFEGPISLMSADQYLEVSNEAIDLDNR
jgi:hypothetical protein